MSRCVDGLRRCNKVNPEEPPIPPDPELWQRRDEFFGCEDQAVAAPPTVPTQPQVQSRQKQDQQQSKKQEKQKRKQEQQQQKAKEEQQQQQQEEQPVVERRKSGGRAKRVRSYLKKCRRAASGGSSSSQGAEEPARTSSWYVEHYHVAEQSQEHVCEEHVCELPLDRVEVLRARDLYDDSADASDGAASAEDGELAAPDAAREVAPRDDAEVVRGERRASSGGGGSRPAEEGRPPDSVELRPGRGGPGDVLDSRNEGGTGRGAAAAEEIPEDRTSAGGRCTADKSVSANLDAESAGTEDGDRCEQSAAACDGDAGGIFLASSRPGPVSRPPVSDDGMQWCCPARDPPAPPSWMPYRPTDALQVREAEESGASVCGARDATTSWIEPSRLGPAVSTETRRAGPRGS
ncbi:mushroom body large-type Kenyon cell-specific protein 1-like [Schistocerca serialis cubense]|uniref:mushroom body large-type Kenyon cell-specific protein 1-like n=1 Tax=Schistocerca serialis cubense TaxID=2023355 RepID=UPI00214EA2F6|nr:mushroom body large-type Kenyon cell-specific protein 1-like [Schistocerca serialis cubense]